MHVYVSPLFYILFNYLATFYKKYILITSNI